mgnify:CR=1 FL=1
MTNVFAISLAPSPKIFASYLINHFCILRLEASFKSNVTTLAQHVVEQFGEGFRRFLKSPPVPVRFHLGITCIHSLDTCKFD